MRVALLLLCLWAASAAEQAVTAPNSGTANSGDGNALIGPSSTPAYSTPCVACARMPAGWVPLSKAVPGEVLAAIYSHFLGSYQHSQGSSDGATWRSCDASMLSLKADGCSQATAGGAVNYMLWVTAACQSGQSTTVAAITGDASLAADGATQVFDSKLMYLTFADGSERTPQDEKEPEWHQWNDALWYQPNGDASGGSNIEMNALRNDGATAVHVPSRQRLKSAVRQGEQLDYVRVGGGLEAEAAQISLETMEYEIGY